MKDFPVFTTEYGVASLVLREIPYRQEAYIIIQSSENPEELLRECISFCRICGAERIYARGHDFLTAFPLHAAILEMRGEILLDVSRVRHLWPVTEENIAKWRKLLNERMLGVDNAATLDSSREREILESGGGYFVHDDEVLLGAGWILDDELMAVAAVRKGAGETVVRTLVSTVPGGTIRLQVASTNGPALRLYERMGFLQTGQQRCWYRVFPEGSVQNPQKA